MSQIALVLLSFAALVTVLFVPLVYLLSHSSGTDPAGAGTSVFLLSFLRSSALTTSLLFIVFADRLSNAGESRISQVFLLILAVAVAEFVCSGISLESAERGSESFVLTVLCLLANVAPALLVVAGFQALLNEERLSPPYCWGSLGLSVVVIIAMVITTNQLDQQRKMEYEQSQRIN
jgi:hypothetical protein